MSSSSALNSPWLKGGLVAAGVMGIAAWLFYSKDQTSSSSHSQPSHDTKRKGIRNSQSSRSTTPINSSPTSASSPTHSTESKTSFAKAAGVAFNEKRYREAINLYTEAIRQDPSNYKLFNNRANAYFALKDYDHVIRDATTSITLAATDNPNAHFINGKALLNLGRASDALIAFQSARLQLGASAGSETILKNLPQFEKEAKEMIAKKKEEEIKKRKEETDKKEKELKEKEKMNGKEIEKEENHHSLTDSTVLVNSTMLNTPADEPSPVHSLAESAVLVEKPSGADEESHTYTNKVHGAAVSSATAAAEEEKSDSVAVKSAVSLPALSTSSAESSESAQVAAVVRECVDDAISSAIAAAGN